MVITCVQEDNDVAEERRRINESDYSHEDAVVIKNLVKVEN